MPNTNLTIGWYTREIARYFSNNLKGVASFNRSYSDEFAGNGGKVGNTVNIRLPQQWEVTQGAGLSVQNILDRAVRLILNKQQGVHFSYGSVEATTDLEEIRSRYVQPAAETLANRMDRDALEAVYYSVYNTVGTLGTTPSATLTLLQAGVKLDYFATPEEGRVIVLDPLAAATIANAQAALFHPAPQISETAKAGMLASNQLGFAGIYKDVNVAKHTSGACPAASTPLVIGANQTGSTLAVDGFGAASAPVKGDIFTVAGVYAVNPLSKTSTGQLQQFVITATPAAGVAFTLSISPSIITSGPLQTVTASPADNAVVTYWSMVAGGTQAATVSPQSLAFHPDAFAVAMADLVMPAGGAKAERVNSKQLKVAMRFVQQYDSSTDENINRIEILWGVAPIQERMACRIVG